MISTQIEFEAYLLNCTLSEIVFVAMGRCHFVTLWTVQIVMIKPSTPFKKIIVFETSIIIIQKYFKTRYIGYVLHAQSQTEMKT